jgi:hypothetical protein
MQIPAPVIPYKTPDPPTKPPPSPLVAVMLCLPGVLCWSLLLTLFLVPRSMQQNFAFLRILSGPGIFLCWGVAIVCALISLAIYLWRRKPWYVWINLLVNVAGLLFSGVVLFLLLWGPGPD